MILCDTVILIELFRGNQSVIEEYEKIGYPNLCICDVTVGQLLYGMRKSEEKLLKKLFNLFVRYRITKEVSEKFIEIMNDNYGAKIKIPDALIAAVAVCNGLTIYTFNTKDFKNVRNLSMYKSLKKNK